MRTLEWDGCRNVRDLGGLPTEDGGETCFRTVVRADSVSRLTAAGWRALLAYGVRTAVDLRRPDELAADPPGPCLIDVVHVSLLGDGDPEVSRLHDALLVRAPDPDAGIRDAYLDMLERYRGNVARAIDAVGRAPAGGVVIHCLVGRDRTGLVAALLLRLADVESAAVAADWAESTPHVVAELDAWVAKATDPVERGSRRRWARGASIAAMEAVLEEIDRRYGGARAYLRTAGAGEAELELARARLRQR